MFYNYSVNMVYNRPSLQPQYLRSATNCKNNPDWKARSEKDYLAVAITLASFRRITFYANAYWSEPHILNWYKQRNYIADCIDYKTSIYNYSYLLFDDNNRNFINLWLFLNLHIYNDLYGLFVNYFFFKSQSNYASLGYFNDSIKEKIILNYWQIEIELFQWFNKRVISSYWQIENVMIWFEIKFTSEKERKREFKIII